MAKTRRPVARPRSQTGETTKKGRALWKDEKTGEHFSEKTVTVPYGDSWVVMPTVAEDGSQYSEEDIAEYVEENGPVDFITGELLPVFETIKEADEYAENRSDTMLDSEDEDEKAIAVDTELNEQEEQELEQELEKLDEEIEEPTDFAKGGIKMEEQMKLFEDGGLMQEGGMVDEESGNEVPVGSTREEVRDDIPANISEGEFIFPADVVRYIGLDRLMKLRQEAKMGLKKMEAMGQMGNSEEATIPDDLPFNLEDLVLAEQDDSEETEERDMNVGGFITTNTGGTTTRTIGTPTGNVTQATPYTAPTTPNVAPNPQPQQPQQPKQTNYPSFTEYMNTGGIEYKSFKNKDNPDDVITVPFVNGKPIYAIPVGYVEATQNTEQEQEQETTQTTSNTDDLESTSVRPEDSAGGPDPGDAPQAPDYSSMSDEELGQALEGTNAAKGIMGAISLANPTIGMVGKMAINHQAKTIQAEIDSRSNKSDDSDKTGKTGKTGKTAIDVITDTINNIVDLFTPKEDKEEETTKSKTTTPSTTPKGSTTPGGGTSGGGTPGGTPSGGSDDSWGGLGDLGGK